MSKWTRKMRNKFRCQVTQFVVLNFWCYFRNRKTSSHILLSLLCVKHVNKLSSTNKKLNIRIQPSLTNQFQSIFISKVDHIFFFHKKVLIFDILFINTEVESYSVTRKVTFLIDWHITNIIWTIFIFFNHHNIFHSFQCDCLDFL